ncbi:MarR family winged helix-turn-helix transcriptional regulator [Labedella endophytica]|nr:MarR family transcriptional regulator [Labedella endophytica]
MAGSDEMHYRSDLVGLLTDLQGIWSDPAFGRRLPGIREHGLSAMEVRVLWTLGFRGPLRGSALADLLGTGAPTVSKAVAKVEARGWVDRHRDEADGRAHDLVLTDAGKAVARDLFDAGDAMMDELLADWTDDDVRAVTGYLDRLLTRSRTFASGLDTD